MGQDLRGITIGGKDLKEELLKQELHEVVEEEKYYLKKGSKMKHKEKKEPNGEVKQTSQSELNILNLDSNIQNAKTNYEKAIALLLAGSVVEAYDLAERFQARDGSAILNKLKRSCLGSYLTKTSSGKKFVYRMDEDGCNLTPAQAIELYKAPISYIKEVEEPAPEPPPETLTVTGNNLPQELNVNINVAGHIKILFGFKLEN